MFVATILAVPVFGLGVATLVLGAAIGSWRADIMPRWWRTATLAAGTLSTVAVFSYADSGFSRQTSNNRSSRTSFSSGC